ncbi:hypothetical protein [Marinisporobacter balticus]|uniref:Uncharacterized protein n=1 Tax=Marinisporobacter balticus TaxID=2018667 RepID=A0A4R2K7C6_9FIRM|nr:hypothetical protein [Marinisporobacter balticus]TCO69241.1 hypothetical protein EV214_13317 [Marinisporobacter balticus]
MDHLKFLIGSTITTLITYNILTRISNIYRIKESVLEKEKLKYLVNSIVFILLVTIVTAGLMITKNHLLRGIIVGFGSSFYALIIRE